MKNHSYGLLFIFINQVLIIYKSTSYHVLNVLRENIPLTSNQHNPAKKAVPTSSFFCSVTNLFYTAICFFHLFKNSFFSFSKKMLQNLPTGISTYKVLTSCTVFFLKIYLHGYYVRHCLIIVVFQQ